MSSTGKDTKYVSNMGKQIPNPFPNFSNNPEVPLTTQSNDFDRSFLDQSAKNKKSASQ